MKATYVLIKTFSVVCILFLQAWGITFAVAEDSRETVNLPVGFVVDTDWLQNYYKHHSVVVVDVRDISNYKEGHIPGAVNIPVQETFRTNSNIELVAPIGHIQELLSEAGIDNDTNIILYDDGEFVNAARVFWVLEVYGHKNLGILDGGLPLWTMKALPVSNTETVREPENYIPTIVPEILATKLSTRLAMDDSDKQIIDARSSDEYSGLKSATSRYGHIPNSVNIPSSLNYRNDNGINRIKPVEELNNIYKDIDSNKKVIAYCNKGKESALTYLILRRLGYRVSAYDGSWQEWSSDPKLPVSMSADTSVKE